MWLINFIKSLFNRKPKPTDRDGLFPSPVDFRDVLSGAVSKKKISLPESYRIPYELSIKQQGLNPFCVGMSSATLKEEKERREQNFLDFDGEWIYRRCKEMDGMPDLKGTYFRTGLKVLYKIGAKLLVGKEEDVSKHRIGGYTKIEKITFESIKQAIYEHGVVLAGFQGSNEGWENANIRLPRPGEKRWGHAVSLIGFDKDRIVFQNSWGKKWGDKGLGYFNKNYLPFEIWIVLTDLPNDWQELLGKDKQKPQHFFREDLKYGMRGREIVMLQDCLKYLGCFDPTVESSGYFGRITLEAIKTFQRRYNISPPFGYVGSLTRAKLNELFAS